MTGEDLEAGTVFVKEISVPNTEKLVEHITALTLLRFQFSIACIKYDGEHKQYPRYKIRVYQPSDKQAVS